MSGSSTLTVASFNIRFQTRKDGRNNWPRRRRAVASLVRSWEADVLALQEVLPRQRRYLQRHLDGYEWYGAGRADGRDEGEQSPVALRSSRFHAREWRTRWLSLTPDVPGSLGWDARIPRVATVVLATAAQPGPDEEIGIISTHFDHRSAAARRGGAELIVQTVMADADRDWVVMGDLNAAHDSDVLAILREGGLRSVLPDDAGGTLHGWSGRRDGARIDHILVHGRWVVEDAWIDHTEPDGRLASDHWPVLARLRRG
ncbi:endonuclease/exonuclease/phosphatase [Epidermidibacterium keratini]|uniref:Endonuclease/exonuclease/phosphatase n=1 Tax=Epidermidibacterium keratini TaxID=1891644 RepID=A0A7L4YR55_9ACTN|nr:endonuclease/exonuclease/phosphatase family protein [Epidermidibacterium keratini]QHC01725.1 endonuclease/exonuclease/phosphatase [Epidermidibacterium keratini]